jgi:hypothetical protein
MEPVSTFGLIASVVTTLSGLGWIMERSMEKLAKKANKTTAAVMTNTKSTIAAKRIFHSGIFTFFHK